jgi:hypothetical protein
MFSLKSSSVIVFVSVNQNKKVGGIVKVTSFILLDFIELKRN